ncbi:hypothetical protein [Edaphocola flava]|uniref:hypothetical protein n=1 Tax=Edaphocola flava TaxID=2499629 RepID=UPI00100B8B22|nr:hypothetical protein [Edaphocola flava]
MYIHRPISLLLLLYCCLCTGIAARAQDARQFLQAGWQALIQDNDTTALRYFDTAYTLYTKQGQEAGQAEALLYMGFASYGSSKSNGLKYAHKALDHYQQLRSSAPEIAALGTGRARTLLATIKARSGQHQEALALCYDALGTYDYTQDTTGTQGIIFHLLGNIFSHLGKTDSADYYYNLALKERQERKDLVYLPGSLIKAGDIAQRAGHVQKSFDYYHEALNYAQQLHNRQAEVSGRIALAKWWQAAGKYDSAYQYVQDAISIARQLSDLQFSIAALGTQKDLLMQEGRYRDAIAVMTRIDSIQQVGADWEKEQLAQNLEVQYDIEAHQHALIQEKKASQSARQLNYILIGAIVCSGVLMFIIFRYQRKNQQQQKALFSLQQQNHELQLRQQAQEQALLQNEIDFKESQLSAMALQISMRNELINELKDTVAQEPRLSSQHIDKLLHKGITQDQEWEEFNMTFESVNKNFQQKLKEKYPEISQNELKICTLIKMNLSIKEMANILNISPDSVKMARYRLRKKLGLKTEDNLAGFIQSL